MLITNFASGELSENLFGRIDIPQYFSGVSRMENFDVIPTGGIKRRGGMERLLKLDEGDGRIIPFVVNRSLGFLLYLTPGTITVFKIENGTLNDTPSVFNNGTGLQLYNNLSEITEVQYAQNFDTMILCHENYAPLEVKYENNYLRISIFLINYDITIEAADELKNGILEFDDFYFNDNILKSENNFPRAVTFFNGRLIFAGTINNPQRIFVSSSDNIHNFSTYKKFLVEVREYISIYASIKEDGKLEIEIPEIAIKFVKPMNEYYIDSLYYPEGARILSIEGSEIEIEGSLNRALFNEVRIENEINSKLNTYNAAETKDSNGWYNNRFNLGYFKYFTFTRRPLMSDLERWTENEYYINYGVHNLQFVFRTRYRTYGNEWYSWQENKKDIKIGDNYIAGKNDEQIKLLIRETITAGEDELKRRHYEHQYINKNNGDYIYNNSNSDYQTISQIDKKYSFSVQELNSIVDSIFNKITNTMKYLLHSEDNGINKWYYNIPSEYKLKIINYLKATQNIYVNFYTKDIKSDSYPTPDCGFTFEISSDMNDAIKWLAVNKGIIVGTETAEWIIPPGIHAANVQAVLNSRYGSDGIQGTAIGDATCFFQTGKKAMVEYYIPQQDNNFRANNMALVSENMLRESPVKEFDFISSPYTKLFITREDGIAVTLLYERSTGTFAWGRITTEGRILSAAVLPGVNGYDEIYLLVKRGDYFFLEALREDTNIYLDSYVKSPVSLSEYDFGVISYDGYAGYPYASRVKSMPILANDKMKPNNIKNILIRFQDSYMPNVKAYPNEKTDVITCGEPYTGIWKTLFPGTWDRDVMFELIHDKPTRCKILSINAEVN